MVDLIYCLEIYYFLLFHYYTIVSISDYQYLSFFWRYISFISYFFIMLIYNFFWIILRWTYATFVISSAFLLPMKSSVASTVFWIPLYETVSSVSAADYFLWSRSFFTVFTTQVFTDVFTNNFIHIFSKREKIYSLVQIFNH